MLIPQPLDRETVRAIREDCEARKIAPTPAQRKQTMADLERAIIAGAFEKGDHNPDGTVLPTDATPFPWPTSESMVRWLLYRAAGRGE